MFGCPCNPAWGRWIPGLARQPPNRICELQAERQTLPQHPAGQCLRNNTEGGCCLLYSIHGSHGMSTTTQEHTYTKSQDFRCRTHRWKQNKTTKTTGGEQHPQKPTGSKRLASPDHVLGSSWTNVLSVTKMRFLQLARCFMGESLVPVLEISEHGSVSQEFRIGFPL